MLEEGNLYYECHALLEEGKMEGLITNNFFLIMTNLRVCMLYLRVGLVLSWTSILCMLYLGVLCVICLFETMWLC